MNRLKKASYIYLHRHIKSDFGMEPYLCDIVKLNFRRTVTAFRLSAHNLEIETGRYVSTAVGNVAFGAKIDSAAFVLMNFKKWFWVMKLTLF